jgi:hypothetical protein
VRISKCDCMLDERLSTHQSKTFRILLRPKIHSPVLADGHTLVFQRGGMVEITIRLQNDLIGEEVSSSCKVEKSSVLLVPVGGRHQVALRVFAVRVNPSIVAAPGEIIWLWASRAQHRTAGTSIYQE